MPRTIGLTELERRKMAEAGRQSIACTNGWRSMDTAPKDCQILGFIVNDYFGSTYIDVTRWVDLENGDGFWDTVDADERVTHWQPLPKPPQGEA